MYLQTHFSQITSELICKIEHDYFNFQIKFQLQLIMLFTMFMYNAMNALFQKLYLHYHYSRNLFFRFDLDLKHITATSNRMSCYVELIIKAQFIQRFNQPIVELV